MQLKNYLKAENIDIKQFAEKSDIALQNLYYWMRGTFKPNKFYQRLISEATNGKVTSRDWNRLHEAPKEDKTKN
jgi:predicted transcriptional regulator